MTQQSVQIQPEQVRAAATAGIKLLTDDDRISIPPSMVQDGTFVLLTGVLQALASGQAVLGNPIPKPEPANDGDDDGDGKGKPQE